MPFQKGQSKPKTGGRKKGTPNKSSLRCVYTMAEEAGVEPFKILLGLCNHRDPAISMNAAKECAKYMYTQKRATEISGPNGQPIQSEVEASAELKEILADLQTIIDTKVNERKG